MSVMPSDYNTPARLQLDREYFDWSRRRVALDFALAHTKDVRNLFDKEGRTASPDDVVVTAETFLAFMEARDAAHPAQGQEVAN